MLVRFEATNYKNFKDPVMIDFGDVGGYQFNADCITGDIISKMLIYGKNGTGKTNLGNALMDIVRTCAGFWKKDSVSELNADSDCDSAKFEYVFRIDGIEVQYAYSKNTGGSVQSESLYVDSAKIFDFDYANKWFWYGNLELIAAETIVVDRFLEVSGETACFSFLHWLFANAVFAADSVMRKLRSYVTGMKSFAGVASVRCCDSMQAMKGENLCRFEEFLHAMGVECLLESRELPDGQNALYFKHNRLLPFWETASAGVKKLYDIYSSIVVNMDGASLVWLDDFDAFLHYETSEKLFLYLKENYPECQIIFTTHNTHLMTNRLTRPDCVGILTRDKKLMPLNKAGSRELREGHNLEKLYMSGEFEV